MLKSGKRAKRSGVSLLLLFLCENASNTNRSSHHMPTSSGSIGFAEGYTMQAHCPCTRVFSDVLADSCVRICPTTLQVVINIILLSKYDSSRQKGISNKKNRRQVVVENLSRAKIKQYMPAVS